jgi:hypothetical protein
MERNVRNVWVDHVTLEASGGESEGFDGLFDMKDNTQYVTLSYSILRNSGRGGLIGSSETDQTNGYVTFHHNRYENIDSRTPLLRGGVAHAYNNHYVQLNESGINSRAGGRVKVENNYFKDSKDVLGTFYTDQVGYWQVSGNVFDNVRWSSPSSTYNPAGPNPTSTTSVSIPYAYTLDPASCVPDVVSRTAGAGTGLLVSDGTCSAQDPDPGATPTPDPTPDPTRDPEPTPEPTPEPEPSPVGNNLSIGAGADGSSKASGTSYGNVIDGSLSTYWSPAGSTGRVSVKWSAPTTVASIVIREESGAVGTIGSWRVVNNDTGAVLATGDGAGVITFTPTSLTKINFEITSSSGAPRVAEFETYADSAPTGSDPVEEVPGQTDPVEDVPGETDPVEDVPGETDPVEDVPDETDPVEEAPDETDPVERGDGKAEGHTKDKANGKANGKAKGHGKGKGHGDAKGHGKALAVAV